MIGVTKSFLPKRQFFAQYVDQIWESNRITSNGQLSKELASKMAAYLQVPYLNLVSSGTLGLQIAIKALDLEGDVITTPFSYVATTSSIVWLSSNPVFVDIEADSWNIIFYTDTEYNYAYYPVLFPSQDLVVNVKEKLKEMGFHARRYFYPALSQLPYVNTTPMPIAEDIANRILCLPLSHEMNEIEIDKIVMTILSILKYKTC